MTSTNKPGRGRSRARSSLMARQPFVLDSHLFYLFGQALGRRDKALGKALAPFGITVPRWRLLGTLRAQSGCSLTRLAELTQVNRTTAMRTVERMRREGLVGRASDQADKRSSVISLTTKGRKLFARIYPIILEHNRRAVEALSAAEVDAFRSTLRLIIDNVSKGA